jgi:hypothetical protein
MVHPGGKGREMKHVVILAAALAALATGCAPAGPSHQQEAFNERVAEAANTPATPAEMDTAIRGSLPDAKWIIIVPPIVFDREVGAQVVDSLAPEAKWFPLPRPYFGMAACENALAKAGPLAAQEYIEDPNTLHKFLYEQGQHARCIVDDGRKAPTQIEVTGEPR